MISRVSLRSVGFFRRSAPVGKNRLETVGAQLSSAKRAPVRQITYQFSAETYPIAISIIAGMLVLAGSPAQAQTAFCGSIAPGTYPTGFNCAPPSGTAATISASAGVDITAPTGADIRAASTNADASISLSGDNLVSNPATTTNGIHAQVSGTSGNASIMFSGAANSVTMGANGDNAVFIQNAGAGNSQISVAAGTGLIINNQANTGLDRDGMEINSTGSGNASILHSGFGSIATANGSGFFLRAANGGNILAEAASGVSFVVNKPAAGGNYAGIRTNNTGGGTTIINSAATMQISGTNAHGMFVQATTGATQITNSGSITVSGLNGFGIRSSASGAGDISVTNSGAITTTGLGGHSIYLTSQGGNVSVTNNGALTVGSTGATEGSRGIYINAFVGGNITVAGSGDITSIGNVNTPRGYAIITNATNGNIDVDYSGR